MATEGHDYTLPGVFRGTISQMPQRPKRIRLAAEAYANGEVAFHVVVRAHAEIGEFTHRVAEAIWASVIEQTAAIRVELYAACLMPDHLHLLLGPKEMNLIAFMNAWKSWTTRAAWNAGHRGPLWQPSFYDRGITDPGDFDVATEYVVMNPVAAGFVQEVRDWPWTWAWYFDEP